MNDIEDRLRHQLPKLADAIVGGETTRREGVSDRAGPSAAGRSEIALVLDDPQRGPKSSPERRGRLLSIAAAAVLVVAGTIAIATIGLRDQSTTDQSASAPTSWTPEGVEFRADDLGPATGQFLGPVVAELTHSIGIADHPPVQVADVITYAGGPTAEVKRCFWWDDGNISGGGCDTKQDGSFPHIFAPTSSPPNGDLWIWDGVPAGTAYVAYTDGATTRWQRPIHGIAAFPNEPNSGEFAVAYGADGTELLRIDESSRTDPSAIETIVRWADISQDVFDDISRLTNDTARQCLEDAGGVVQDSGLAALPSDANSSRVWQSCIEHTKQVVANQISRLDVTFYDPVTERPEHPEPWMQFNG